MGSERDPEASASGFRRVGALVELWGGAGDGYKFLWEKTLPDIFEFQGEQFDCSHLKHRGRCIVYTLRNTQLDTEGDTENGEEQSNEIASDEGSA